MSRIGKKPVPLPKGVTAAVQDRTVIITGPKGELVRTIHADLTAAIEDNAVVVRRPSDQSRHKALHGLTRTLIANMVDGVTKGFVKQLEIQGVGYKAEVKPFGVQLTVGLSHPVQYHAPKGIKISVDNNVLVKIEGIDKELVDDTRGVTLLGASDRTEGIQPEAKGKTGKSLALGQLIAARAKAKGIARVVFDRGGYQYHGRVKAVADGARKGGLEF